VINEYIDDYLPIKSNRKNNRELDRQLRWWEKELGKVALQNLDTPMIAKARKKLSSAGRAGGTVNRYLTALSGCLTHCMKELDYGLKENPVRNVKRLAEPKGRSRYLDDNERDDL